jgi:hypothetical protein
MLITESQLHDLERTICAKHSAESPEEVQQVVRSTFNNFYSQLPSTVPSPSGASVVLMRPASGAQAFAGMRLWQGQPINPPQEQVYAPVTGAQAFAALAGTPAPRRAVVTLPGAIEDSLTVGESTQDEEGIAPSEFSEAVVYAPAVAERDGFSVFEPALQVREVNKGDVLEAPNAGTGADVVVFSQAVATGVFDVWEQVLGDHGVSQQQEGFSVSPQTLASEEGYVDEGSSASISVTDVRQLTVFSDAVGSDSSGFSIFENALLADASTDSVADPHTRSSTVGAEQTDSSAGSEYSEPSITKVKKLPSGTVVTYFSDGSARQVKPDGTVLMRDASGRVTVTKPSQQGKNKAVSQQGSLPEPVSPRQRSHVSGGRFSSMMGKRAGSAFARSLGSSIGSSQVSVSAQIHNFVVQQSSQVTWEVLEQRGFTREQVMKALRSGDVFVRAGVFSA